RFICCKNGNREKYYQTSQRYSAFRKPFDPNIESMLKVTAVSYLNTKPFLYGLLSSPLMDHLEIDLAIPSECARKLKSGEAEIGLVPVAVLPELDNYKIISGFGIGCEGPVASVCL